MAQILVRLIGAPEADLALGRWRKKNKSLQKDGILRVQDKTQGAKVIGIIWGAGGGLVTGEDVKPGQSLQQKNGILRFQHGTQGTEVIGIIWGDEGGLVSGEDLKLCKPLQKKKY